MFLIDYPCIREKYLPYYSKNVTWNLLHAYIDAKRQILIDQYPGDLVQSISILKPQCPNITFSDQIRYDRLFQKVVHKEGESKMNYIKIFQNVKNLAITVVKSYSEDHLMHTFFKKLQKYGKYYAQIASH